MTETLQQTIKKRFADAMRAQDTVTKEILRLAIGELSTVESRVNRALTDDEVLGVVRKLVKSNEETLSLSEDDAQKATLRREIAVLAELLPATLTAEQIAAALAPVADAVRAAKSDGQATGVAMKHVKSAGLAADGNAVAAAVKLLRWEGDVARRSRMPIVVGALAGAVIVGGAIAAAALAPGWVRDRAIDEAARQGVTLEVQDVALGFPELRLLGIRAKLRDVPQVTVDAAEARVTLAGLTPSRVSLPAARVTVDGSLADSIAAFERAVSTATPSALTFELAGPATWRGVLGPSTQATGVVTARAVGPSVNASVDGVRLATGAGALGPWRAQLATSGPASTMTLLLDREGGARVELARGTPGVRFALDVPRAAPASLGIPAAVLGVPASAQIEVHVGGALVGATAFTGSARASVFQLPLGLLSADASFTANVAGDARGPMRVSQGAVTLGPVRADVSGTFQIVAPLGARADLAWQAGPTPCPFLPGPSIFRGRLHLDTTAPTPWAIHLDAASICGASIL